MTTERITSRKGLVYEQTVVADVSDKVPEEYKGKFLLYSPTKGALVVRKPVPLSEEEKQSRKNAREEKVKARYSEKNAKNKEANEKLEKLNKKLSEVKKESLVRVRKGEDVSVLLEKRAELEKEQLELRAIKRPVPKKYRV